MTRQDSETGERRPPLDVAAVRVLYEAGDVPVAEIRRRFRLSEYEFRRLRLREGWTPRRQIADPRAGRAGRAGRKPPAVRLAARLLRSLNRQIAMLEDRVMADDYEQNDADIRLMNELARGVERIGRLLPAGDAGAAAGKQPDNAMEAEAADVEWMRDKLRKRLARLADRQRSRSAPEGDDG